MIINLFGGGLGGGGGGEPEPTYDSVLANNTPAQIQAAARAGVASTLWSVGDITSVITFGYYSVGSLDLNGISASAYIIGFDHNSTYEGTGIHFQFGKISGVDIAFYSASMNASGTNSGGWDNCALKSNLTNFYNALPAEWQAVIADCDKYTDNTGNSSTSAADVTKTTGKIWLLSEYEVFAATSYANNNEAAKQAQYQYYVNGNSPIKYRHNATTTATAWWLRSPDRSNGTNFVYSRSNGSSRSNSASTAYGFAPAFKVA